ncbi:MAG: hypothetical protein AB1861_19125 [Cyanobacteriota bacterium]
MHALPRVIRKTGFLWALVAVGAFQGLLITWMLPTQSLDFRNPPQSVRTGNR